MPGASGFAYPERVRHNWGMTTTAADGHAEWLRMPKYQPNAAAPVDMEELGDCSETGSVWAVNPRVKLWMRVRQTAPWF